MMGDVRKSIFFIPDRLRRQVGVFSGYRGFLESHTIPHRRLWHPLRNDIFCVRAHLPHDFFLFLINSARPFFLRFGLTATFPLLILSVLTNASTIQSTGSVQRRACTSLGKTFPRYARDGSFLHGKHLMKSGKEVSNPPTAVVQASRVCPTDQE